METTTACTRSLSTGPTTGTIGACYFNHEKGAALLIAIVMLFMLSMLGVSAMRGAKLERNMADNAIFAAEAFQFAESATDMVLNDQANLGAAFTRNGSPLLFNPEFERGDTVDAAADVRYVGDGLALGYSFGEGSNNFISLRYTVEGRASIPAVRSSATVDQGAYRVVPAP